MFDLLGQKFGGLTVLRRGPNVRNGCAWFCKCACGKITLKEAGHLRRKTRPTTCCSLACPINKARMSIKSATHGMSKHRAYNIWAGIWNRCLYPNHRSWKYYGGRGISVCRRWESFENFWKDMGPTYKDDLIIDRRDNDGNYTPKNCRWTTYTQNNRNRRDNLNLGGFPHNFVDIALSRGFKKANLYQRIHKGLTWEQVLNTPRYVHTHRNGHARS